MITRLPYLRDRMHPKFNWMNAALRTRMLLVRLQPGALLGTGSYLVPFVERCSLPLKGGVHMATKKKTAAPAKKAAAPKKTAAPKKKAAKAKK